jgi:hypothetical protein
MIGGLAIISKGKDEASNENGDKASNKCVSRTRCAVLYKESPQNIEKRKDVHKSHAVHRKHKPSLLNTYCITLHPSLHRWVT